MIFASGLRFRHRVVNAFGFSTLLHMFRNIYREHPEIRNVKQIRNSLITHWKKHYNFCQVQYMAGHKYVSSTERYQLDNLDKLQGRLEKYHPLEQNNK